jgi:oxygen-independent coproporphyrinogen-3 oxidase
MDVHSIHGLAVDLDKVRAAVGGVPRVAYEAAHVYPLSAPQFTRSPRVERERPAGGPLRLYVHVPFCRYACTFCFYAKRVNTPRSRMQRYVDALRRELDALGDESALQQLYVGGGTPTVLPPDLLDQVLAAVTERLSLDRASCHTVEASPESLTAEHVDVVKRRGIGRVSLGVQTLDEGILQSINRRHSARQALDACERLVGSGLSVNVDLIYGFPGQSADSLRHDLAAFTALGTHAFALYNLRLNEHTPLARVVGDLERVDLPALMRWRRWVELVTEQLGFRQVRWHTFLRRDQADPGHDRAPGTNAFGSGREIGIGVSAFSHLGETIYRNHLGFDGYLQRVEAGDSPVEEIFSLRPAERRTLFVARTIGDGRTLDFSDYERTFGRRFDDDYGSVVDRLARADLVRQTDGRLALTETGRLVYDLVTLAFFPEDARRWLAGRQERRPSEPAAYVLRPT